MTLTVTARVPDRDDPERMTTIVNTQSVPPSLAYLRDPGQLIYWLRSAVREVEWHEIDEWFTVDGVRVYDPHRKKDTT